MNDSNVSFVVGADGTIGSTLASTLAKLGWPVLGTTRRRTTISVDRPFLDLSEDAFPHELPKRPGVAYLCAGVTKLAACRRDPVGTARINVDGVGRLVQRLVAQGAFVVYISSNQVFDGTSPQQAPDLPYSPCTEYGRQKAAAERLVSQWGDAVAIVRLTKVLGAESLLSNWAKALKKKQPISPFSDMTVAPVPLATVVSVLSLVGQGRRSGVWQVSGERDVSYAEAARLGAKVLGVDESLVKPIQAADSGLCLEPVPTYTSLSIERLKSELGMAPPPVEWTIRTAFTQPGRLDGFSRKE